MALQTKTFSWGSYTWQSESNAYVLELTLTENSTDKENNTSNITYKLVLKSGSNNRFSGQIDSVIKLAGKQVASGSKQITAAYNSSWTLLSGTTDVSHNSDGSLNMPIVVSIDTFNSYAPPDKTLNWSWTLTDIPRASSITSAGNVLLGKACSVRWTPKSASFTYKLKFSLGTWSKTISDIAPKKTSAYTYADYVIPLSVANQIAGTTEKMTVVLTTYSGSTAVGNDEETFTVTVPENSSTKPAVTMTLAPVKDWNGLYLQGRTKVQGTLNASGKCGASIESLTMTVCGKTYESPFLSKALTTSGKVAVVATAVDSRGFTGTAELSVDVAPYYKPILKTKAYRCMADETPNDAGEFLKIEASVEYATVNGKNSCALYYCYKAETASEYCDFILLKDGLSSGDSVKSGALLDGKLLKENAYSVQVVAVDTVGEKTPSTIPIACERIFRHKRPGGRGMGFGGYCSEDDMLDVHWNQRIRKDLTVDGSINGICESEEYPGCYYRNVDGETDWLNPPMEPGVEYRTTERQSGNPVYVQVFTVDSLPNTGRHTITHDKGISDTEFVRAEAVACRKGSDGVSYSYYNFPMISDGGAVRAVIQYGANAVFITTFADVSAYGARVTIWYSKH